MQGNKNIDSRIQYFFTFFHFFKVFSKKRQKFFFCKIFQTGVNKQERLTLARNLFKSNLSGYCLEHLIRVGSRHTCKD